MDFNRPKDEPIEPIDPSPSFHLPPVTPPQTAQRHLSSGLQPAVHAQDAQTHLPRGRHRPHRLNRLGRTRGGTRRRGGTRGGLGAEGRGHGGGAGEAPKDLEDEALQSTVLGEDGRGGQEKEGKRVAEGFLWL